MHSHFFQQHAFAINLTAGVSVGEDLGNQVKSSFQWSEGLVKFPNQYLSPNKSDLSKDTTIWNLSSGGFHSCPYLGF